MSMNDVSNSAGRVSHMSLKHLLASGKTIVAPGVFDALTASIATEAGFEALYLSGAALAYTRLGRSDIGLVSMTEIADTISLIRDRTEVPLIVDADNGYGNALNVLRTTRYFERAGANAIQIEDQTLPKRCGHLADKSLISAEEMAGKIKAAVDARASEETLIIARTDAVAVEGFESAIERANLYAEAGADILFVEAPRSREQLQLVSTALADVRPLLANMVEGGTTPLASADELGAMGFRIVIFPGGIVRALARTAVDYYRSLAQAGTNEPFRDRMYDFSALNELIGTPEMLALGRKYGDFHGERDASRRPAVKAT
jgi:2-methylisocitrate lyase-like PEP mutase family enzyme